MKKLFAIFVLNLVLVLALSSCSNIWVCNSIDTGYLCILEKDGETHIKSNYSNVYSIDLENKTFALVDDSETKTSWFEQEDPNAFEFSMFAEEYGYTVPTGYEGVLSYIEECKLDNDSSVVDACGYLRDGLLFGFVRVYKDTRGVYGNYSIEEIDHSLVFTYNPETDKFTVEYKLDNVVIVAVFEDTVIYWKDKAYYKYNLKTQQETYLIDDKAYDSGLNQLSTAGVYLNSEICVIHIHMMSKDTDYLYVYDWSNDNFFELTEK